MLSNDELWGLSIIEHIEVEERLECRGRLAEAQDALDSMPETRQKLLDSILPEARVLQSHDYNPGRHVAVCEAKLDICSLGDAALSELHALLRNPRGIVCQTVLSGLVRGNQIAPETMRAIEWCNHFDGY